MKERNLVVLEPLEETTSEDLDLLDFVEWRLEGGGLGLTEFLDYLEFELELVP